MHTQLSHDFTLLFPFNIVKSSQKKKITLTDEETYYKSKLNCAFQMLQPHHLQRETTIQSHQTTDNDSIKVIIEDCEDILLELGLQYTILCSILFYF